MFKACCVTCKDRLFKLNASFDRTWFLYFAGLATPKRDWCPPYRTCPCCCCRGPVVS